MALIYKDLYRKGHLSMPSVLSPQEDKDKEWALNIAQYVFGRFENDDFAISNDGLLMNRRSIGECRSYSRGLQPTKKYEDVVLFKDKAGNAARSISMDTYKILPKFMAIAKRKILTNDLEPKVQVNDLAGIRERNRQLAKYKLYSTPEIKELADTIGYDYGEFSIPGVESPEEIDVFQKLGGILLDIEIELNDAIQAATRSGNYPLVESNTVVDLMELGMAAMYVHTYPDLTMEVRPVEMSRAIMPYTDRQDTANAPYAGFVEQLNVHEVAEMFDVEDMDKLVHKASKYHNANPDRARYIRGNGAFDGSTLDVLRLWVVCQDEEYYVDGQHHKYGNAVFDKINKKSKVRDKSKEKKRYIIHEVYEIAWVIGTDCILRCKKDQVVARDGKKGYRKALLPIIMHRMDVPSLVERAIPIIDDMQIAIYKMRQLLSKLPPGPRMVIMKNVLRPSVKMGDHSYSMLDMLELFQREGLFVLDLEDDFDTERYHNFGKPIEFIQSGLAEDLAIIRSEIAAKMEELRQVTGINEVADGSSPNKDMLRSVMRGLDEASNSALSDFYEARKDMTRRLYRYIGRKSQEIAYIEGDRGYVYSNNGEYDAKVVSQEIAYFDFDIDIDIIPSKQEGEMLLQIIAQDKQQRVINDADFFAIQKMILDGDIKKAQLFYSIAVQREKQEQQEQQMAMHQMQSQNNAMAANAAQQRDVGRLQGQVQIEQAKGQIKASLNEQKAILKERQTKQ